MALEIKEYVGHTPTKIGESKQPKKGKKQGGKKDGTKGGCKSK